MAISRIKEFDNVFLSNCKVQTKIDSTIRTSMEGKIACERLTEELQSEVKNNNNVDTESAYEESFCSDDSDLESEITNVSRQSSNNEIPLCRFTISKSHKRERNLRLPVKRSVSSPKLDESNVSLLEEKMKCLDFKEVRPTRSAQIRASRKNMSFTNEQVFQIERDNEYLLRKIMAQQKPKRVKATPVQLKLTSSAVNRKNFQRKIEMENMTLLRRLQQAKSCAVTSNKIPGFRTMHS